MKRTVLLTILLLAFISLSAQTIVYQVSDITTGKINKSGEMKKGKTSKTTNLICKINMEMLLIAISNEAGSIYELTVPAIDYIVKYDDDGYQHTTTSYWATDEEGIRCMIILIDYTTLNYTAFTAVYDDIYVRFYMKKV